MDPLLGATIIVLLFGVATLVADGLPARWRFVPAALLGLLLAAAFMELVRYDHGHGRLLFWLGHVAAPLFVLLSLGYRYWRHRGGKRARLRHLNRATHVAFFIVLGVWAGVSMRVGDLSDSVARGNELVDGWPSTIYLENTWTDHRTELGWLAPPFYWVGTNAQGRRIVAFPKGGGEWHVRDLGQGGWKTVDYDPTVAARKTDTPP